MALICIVLCRREVSNGPPAVCNGVLRQFKVDKELLAALAAREGHWQGAKWLRAWTLDTDGLEMFEQKVLAIRSARLLRFRAAIAGSWT